MAFFAETYAVTEKLDDDSCSYRGYDKSMGREVVVKALNAKYVDADFFEKLKHEYRILSSIESERVIKLLDFRQEGSDIYMVQECSPGTLLADLPRCQTELRRFFAMAKALVAALDDIHGADVIHSAISPFSIVCTNDERVCVITGFEDAFFKNEIPTSHSGHTEYISPEQTGRVDSTISFASDLYSLGVVFYEILAGRPPFEGSESELLYAHIAKEARPLCAENPQVPEMVAKIIEKLMEKDPERRYGSAACLLSDIRQAAYYYELYGHIPVFEPGMFEKGGYIDFSDRLYGRDADKEKLRDAADFAVKNKRCLITVSGHSGIGKSSLVEWIRRRNAGSGAIYVEGKFDQNHKNVPYYAIFKAFDDFCTMILGEEPEKLEKWRARLTEALKANGRLLISKIPQLAFLISECGELPNLSPIEERALFVSVAGTFLKTIASAEHPLIIFTDDTQHIDYGSAEFITEMMLDDDLQYCLWICCYRDNEVEAGHPFAAAMAKIKKKDESLIEEIRLSPLSEAEVAQMVNDLFSCGEAAALELARIVHRKTGGNPFYIKEFLRFCRRNGAIAYDRETGWSFAWEAISEVPAEENVVDFIMKTFMAMKAEDITLLTTAASAGNSFSVGMISEISGCSEERVEAAFADFAAQGILRRSDSIVSKTFVFAHDRFQQAFYSMLDEYTRRGLHYRIAVYNEKHDSGKEATAFIIADNYYQALGSAFDACELIRILKLLLGSAIKAEKISAFDTALRYIQKINEYLPRDYKDHDFLFLLYSVHHSILCSLSLYSEADAVYEKVKETASGPIELADSCAMQSITLTSRMRYEAAFMLNAGELEKLGVKFSPEGLSDRLPRDAARLKSILNDPDYKGMHRCAPEDEARECAIGKLLSRNVACGLFFDPDYSVWASLESSLRMMEKGYALSGFSCYISTAVYFTGTGSEYGTAYRIARDAIKTAEKNDLPSETVRIYHVFSLMIGHWFEKAENMMRYSREAHRLGNEMGDFEYACYAYFTSLQIVLESCVSLDELKEEAGRASAYAFKKNSALSISSFALFARFADVLSRTDTVKDPLSAGLFSSEELLKGYENEIISSFYFNVLRAYLAVIFGDYAQALPYLETAQELAPHLAGFYVQADRVFLHAAVLCRMIDASESAEERERYKEKLFQLRALLQTRAVDAPFNLSHLLSYIDAECTAVFDEGRAIISLYEKAMDEAAANKRPLHYALICELAAQRFFKLGASRTGEVFFKESYNSYKVLGAHAKCADMKRKASPELRAAVSQEPPARLTGRSDFDFDAVIKASQALSEELSEERILQKFTEILIRSAGAQDIFYVARYADSYKILSQTHILQGPEVTVKEQTADANMLPLKLLNYVQTTQKILLPDKDSALIKSDPYFKDHGCSSVICIPAISKGIVRGFLYMENNALKGVFTEKQSRPIQAIVTQLAISLENAYLYNNLKELVEVKTQKLNREAAIRKEAEKKLYHLAHHDFLTDLPNRRSFYNYLEQAIVGCRSKKKTAALFFIDLDGFKDINDQYSHKAGDAVLREVTARIQKSVRRNDIAARLGGDEFTVILEDILSAEELETICRRLCEAIGQPMSIAEADKPVFVTASIGVSVYGKDGCDSNALLMAADTAMYKAKNAGKNCWAFYSDDYGSLTEKKCTPAD